MTYLDSAIEVLNIFEHNGYKAYLVGGFVRDYLFNSPINDIDICTNAKPEAITQMFEAGLKGIKYNSVVIKHNGYEFETTTFRKELGTTDNRHPIYVETDDILDDLVRRDFTVNAMAMDKDLNLIDLYGGKSDLEAKVIKTVGNPRARFTDDALRMLRACYFASKLGFSIERDTLKAIKECAHLIQVLSTDRILWELEKLCASKYNLIGFKYICDTGIVKYLGNLRGGIEYINKKQIIVSDLFEMLTICYYNQENKLIDLGLKSDLRNDILDVIALSKANLKNNYSNADIFDHGINRVLRANKLNMNMNKAKDSSSILEEAYKSFPISKMSDLDYKINYITRDFNIRDMKKAKEMIIDARNEVLSTRLPNNSIAIKNYLAKKYM